MRMNLLTLCFLEVIYDTLCMVNSGFDLNSEAICDIFQVWDLRIVNESHPRLVAAMAGHTEKALHLLTKRCAGHFIVSLSWAGWI